MPARGPLFFWTPAGFWTLDRTTITGRSAVILRQDTTPFRPMIVPLDDLELVLSKLEKLKPLHTRKFPRVNAQDSRLGPIQPWDVKDFLGLSAVGFDGAGSWTANSSHITAFRPIVRA